jgi:hypothetical protein
MRPDDAPVPPEPPRKPVRATSIAPPPGWFEPAPKKPVRAKLVERGEAESGTRAGGEVRFYPERLALCLVAIPLVAWFVPDEFGVVGQIGAGVIAGLIVRAIWGPWYVDTRPERDN